MTNAVFQKAYNLKLDIQELNDARNLIESDGLFKKNGRPAQNVLDAGNKAMIAVIEKEIEDKTQQLKSL